MENMTAKVSCFARAYHHKNNRKHIFDDTVAEKLLGKDYEESPSVLARSAYCESRLARERKNDTD